MSAIVNVQYNFFSCLVRFPRLCTSWFRSFESLFTSGRTCITNPFFLSFVLPVANMTVHWSCNGLTGSSKSPAVKAFTVKFSLVSLFSSISCVFAIPVKRTSYSEWVSFFVWVSRYCCIHWRFWTLFFVRCKALHIPQMSPDKFAVTSNSTCPFTIVIKQVGFGLGQLFFNIHDPLK